MGKATRWLKGLFGIKTANKDPIPGKIGASGAEVARFQHADGERERNKHVIAVAAATTAAADAAVAAALAAAEVVRLTSRDRNHHYNIKLITGAVTIQANFRGYLARKALRALKGVVKIQALVRGYLVRKQAAATLHGIEALFRAQATVQSRRASNGFKRGPVRPEPLSWARPSMGEFGDGIETEQYYDAPMPSVRSRRMSASFEARTLNPPNGPGTAKVVEVDVGRPGSKSGRRGPVPNTPFSELGEDPSSSYQVLPSQFQFHFQSHSHFVPCHHNCFHDKEWGLESAHTTPRISNLGCGPDADVLQQLYYHYPHYMAKTMSFKAKLRAHSAPKQRPETKEKRSCVSERKRGMPMMEGRNSTGVSGVRMQRSSSHVQEAFNFKNVVMGKIGKLPLLH